MSGSFATTVIKVGGELLLPEAEAALSSLVRSLADLVRAGTRLVVVHGGGPQTSALMRRLGQEPRLEQGRRVTDADALWSMVRAVRGEVNVRLTGRLVAEGLPAVGLDGLAGQCIRCVKEPPQPSPTAPGARLDYGYVGEITHVDGEFIEMFLQRAMVPVIACLGGDENGHPLNVNADTVARGVASALRSDHLVFVTGAPGVLRDRDEPNSRIPRLRAAEARAAIESGVIAGGMIPKVKEAFAAFEGGVAEVHVLGQLGPGELEQALTAPGSIGTVLEP